MKTITTNLKGNEKQNAIQWLKKLKQGDTIRIREDYKHGNFYTWEDKEDQFRCITLNSINAGKEYLVQKLDINDCSIHVGEGVNRTWISWAVVDLTQFENNK